ncbi:tetratricopeptide repeat protein [Oryzibacter oryziterrae]|uniref:tetratricopeptide repeat protein n=1 Tax=Oryzibacter oryziterrae TaxID=2766474 RepID=UPI001F2C4FD2|nr:tetratricopeptide repeat protein [Oryzibacter oryziterrae]
MNALKSASRRLSAWRHTRRLAGVSLVALAAIWSAPALSAPQPLLTMPMASSMEGNYLAGRFAGQTFDYQASADYFAEALLFDPEDPFLLERALSLYMAAGESSVVREYAERLRDADHGSPLAALALGVDDFRRGRWSVAVEELKGAKNGPLLSLVSEVMSAWAEQGAGKTALAIQRLDKLDGEKWYEFFRDYHAGLIASVSGDDKLAADYFQKALAIDDSSVITIDAGVRALARSGDKAGAQKLLDKANKSGEPHPVLEPVMADLAAGRKPAPHVQTVQQGASEILSGLGSAIIREDNNDMGMIFLQQALAVDPTADLTRITLAQTYERANRYQDALNVLEKVSNRSPMKRDALIMAAFDYNSLDKVDEAKAALRKVIKKDGTDMEALVSLGNIMRVRKMFDEAATTYSKAIDQLNGKPSQKDWQLYYNRGITYERTNRWPLAEADFRKSLELQPDQPLVLNYLGYTWVDKGINLDQGLEMIRKAVDGDPTNGLIIDSLGWAYYKLGQYDRAVTELERAIDLMPADPTINDHLGDAYWRVGRKLEARFQWNHALASKPEADEKTKIEAKLKDGLVDPAPAAAAEATTTPKPTAKP